MSCRRFAPLLLAILVIVPTAVAQDGHLWVGPNVNMVSGTTFPDGDPFLQRQNEPSVAVSTRNVMHLMGFANDYRAVDIPFLIDDEATGDAWLGVFKSFDGGQTWRSTLLPGYPQGGGTGSPLFGYQAGADPVVRAGTHGLFYLSGIVFNREEPKESAVFVSRYMDLNNREGGDPISYIDTTIVKANNPVNFFIDKPWLAVDIPRNTMEHTLTVPQDEKEVAQMVTCGNVYLAWAEIRGPEGDHRSDIVFTRSTDCGTSWHPTPIILSDSDTMNQGVTVAVSPQTGDVWVAWRQFDTVTQTTVCTSGGGYWKNHPEEWPLEFIAMGGEIYPKDEAVDILNTPPREDATYILAKQLIPAKLNVGYSMVGGGVNDLIAAADAWLANHPLGSKPSGADKKEGLALKDQLEDFNNTPIEGGECPRFPGPDDTIWAVHSSNGGQSFTDPIMVSPLYPFEQGTTEVSFRTNAYPTMTVDDSGRAYLAWATRGLATPRSDVVVGDARIVVATSTDQDPYSWTAPQPIDRPEVPGHQIEPSMTFAGGQLMLVYYDLRRDISGIFDRFIADWPSVTPVLRHTVDVRVAHAEPGEYPVFTDYEPVTPGGSAARPSDQVSRYAFTTNEPENPGSPELLQLVQLQFNPPNLPIFVGGTKPFFGDYIDVAASPPFLPDLVLGGSGGWRYNSLPEDGAVVHAVWTDNRDVEAPPDGDWTNYIPPTDAPLGTPSNFDPVNYDVPVCEPYSVDEGRTRIRNQNTYTARVSHGLFVAVPGGARPLGELQRAFVIFVRNESYEDKSFLLTIADPPEGVVASFEQYGDPNGNPVTSLEVDVAPYSSFARTVFITSTDPLAAVRVNVTEINPPVGSDPLTRSVLINGDSTAPPPADMDLLNAEDYNLAMMNRSVVNLAMMNLAMMNDPVLLAMMNLAMMNPALVSTDLISLAMMNLAMMNLAMMNPDVESLAMMNPNLENLAMMNPAIYSLAMMNAAMMDPEETNLAMMNLAMMNDPANLAMMNVSEATWKVENTGSTAAGYSFNLLAESEPPSEEFFEFQLFVYKLYATPVADGCELKQELQHQMTVSTMDPEFLRMDELERFLDPETDVSDESNVTFYLEPGEEVFVTLWIIDLDTGDDVDFGEDEVSAATVVHGEPTDEIGDGDDQPPFDSDIGDNSSIAELTINEPTWPLEASVGVPFSYTLTATGGQGPRTWSFAPASTVPEDLSIDAFGNLSWTPTTAGTFNFTVRVIDQTQQATETLDITVNAIPMVPLWQRNALIALYNSTNGPGWADSTGWLGARSTECDWFGVACGSPTVVRIELSSNNLSGPLPAELGNLVDLQLLDFRDNQLTGNIPPVLGNLSNLEQLDVYNNELEGNIPPELGNLTSIEILQLGANQLDGSIPPELGNLPNLERLYLYVNELTGDIPVELTNVPNLRHLWLNMNELTGNIPPELGNVSNLRSLALYGNQLSGSIPPALGNLSNLSSLDLINNQLTGSIPVELASLSMLSMFRLGNNQLTGRIPPELGTLTGLRYLELFNNQLTGEIPPELGNLSNLLSLRLDGNRLAGSIPPELGNLSGLDVLRLSGNRLGSLIPDELLGIDSLRFQGSDFRWNALFSNNQELIDYWNYAQDDGADWQITQTIAPTNLDPSAPTTTSVTLSWTPITYTDGGGGYEVLISTVPGGPYVPIGRTVGKTVMFMVVDGLGPGTAYYFVVRTITDPVPDNQNTVISDFSVEVDETTAGSPLMPSPQRDALIALYNSTNGPGWADSTGWLGTPGTECDWSGVYCTNNQVVALNLAENNLVGTIPPAIGDLIFLENLTLGGNQLSGNLPSELGNLTNLGNIDLWVNQLTGSIPPQLGNLSNLTRLRLDANSLTGSIPPQLASLSNLELLFLQSNQLDGTIPVELGSLFNLQWMYLSHNQLTGLIPPELGNLTSLQYLGLHGNQLSGEIPERLGNLSNLLTLNLVHNQLTGTIPASLGNLSNLQWLVMADNLLTGSIPPELRFLTNLLRLDLENNDLTGGIPPQLGELANLERLSLYNNELSGDIPAEIGDLAALQDLNLNRNRLTGPIPEEFEDLHELEQLNLAGNQLSGAIPAGIQFLGIQEDNSDIAFNALFSLDDGLTTFLNYIQWNDNWQGTQTVAPSDFIVDSTTDTSVTLTWTRIDFTGYQGGYDVYFSEVLGGTYTIFGRTEDKYAQSIVVDGLDPNTEYFFYVQTVTEPHGWNSNTVFSDTTEVISATTDP